MKINFVKLREEKMQRRNVGFQLFMNNQNISFTAQKFFSYLFKSRIDLFCVELKIK